METTAREGKSIKEHGCKIAKRKNTPIFLVKMRVFLENKGGGR
jgi:hypothetical protein